jgi:putative phage-type endonuclease
MLYHTMDVIKLIEIIRKYIQFVEENNIKNLEQIKHNIDKEDLNEIEYKHLISVILKLINPDEDYDIYNDGTLLSSKYKSVIITNTNEKQFNKLKNNFDKIRAIISHPQRSPEWYNSRNNAVTASDLGCVLGLNKYEPQYKFIFKKVFGSDFKTNDACYYGKKFETACVRNYEYLNNCIVDEFGLLQHPNYSYICASPDGIVNPFDKNGNKCKLASRMVEIKCLSSRILNHTGDIYDFICPKYYYSQIQQQLQTCNIKECDFIQYKIEEYETREDYLNDTHEEYDFKSKKTNLERGILIEIMPTKLEEHEYSNKSHNQQSIYDYATHIYPPKIDVSIDELNEWVLFELDKLKKKFDVKLNKIIYYRVIDRNHTLIVRDDEWFEKNLNTIKKMWDYVLFLRNDENMANKWKKFINELSIKNNKKIMDYLDKLYNSNNEDVKINYK